MERDRRCQQIHSSVDKKVGAVAGECPGRAGYEFREGFLEGGRPVSRLSLEDEGPRGLRRAAGVRKGHYLEARLSEALSDRLRGLVGATGKCDSEVRTGEIRGPEPSAGSSPWFSRIACLGLICWGEGASGQLGSWGLGPSLAGGRGSSRAVATAATPVIG